MTNFNGIAHSHRKTEKVFLTAKIFDVCTRDELEYRIDVCRVTRGAHIEHL
jgi:hypothetical protein